MCSDCRNPIDGDNQGINVGEDCDHTPTEDELLWVLDWLENSVEGSEDAEI